MKPRAFESEEAERLHHRRESIRANYAMREVDLGTGDGEIFRGYKFNMRSMALATIEVVTGDGVFIVRDTSDCPFCPARAHVAHCSMAYWDSPEFKANRMRDEVSVARNALQQHLEQMDDVFECFLCHATVTRRDLDTQDAVVKEEQALRVRLRNALRRARHHRAR